MAPDADPDSEQEADPPCRLFELPQELRDIIYEHACEFEIRICSRIRESMSTLWGRTTDIRLRAKSTNMGMLKACKQLRVETQKIWYEHTIFHFSSPVACSAWLKRHVPETFQAALKHLRIAGPEDNVSSLDAVRDGSCSSISIGLAGYMKENAQDTLLSVAAQIRQPLLSVLTAGALQVEMFNSKWQPVWTSKPGEVALPKKCYTAPIPPSQKPKKSAQEATGKSAIEQEEA